MNSTNSFAGFKISIWGNYPECQHCPIADYLWHDVVSSLPEIGSVLKIDGTAFQVEGVGFNQLWIYEEDKDTYVIDVRPYEGTVAPTLEFPHIDCIDSD